MDITASLSAFIPMKQVGFRAVFGLTIPAVVLFARERAFADSVFDRSFVSRVSGKPLVLLSKENL